MQSPNIESQPTITQELPVSEVEALKQPIQKRSGVSNQKSPSSKSNFLTFTIVFGVLSIVVSILSPCGMLFGIIGTVFGFKAKEITENNSLANTGIILNIVGLILSLIFAILYAIILSAPEILK